LIFALIVVEGAEDCSETCSNKFKDQVKENASCSEGCRLSLLLQFAAGRGQDRGPALINRCQQSCGKAFDGNKASIDACSFGCNAQSPVNGKNVQISFDGSDPTFNEAKNIMNDMFEDMQSSFGFPSDSLGKDDGDDQEWASPWSKDPFVDMRKEMQRMRGLADRLFQRHFGQSMGDGMNPRLTGPRNHGAITGTQVGNHDENGQELIKVEPVDYDDQYNARTMTIAPRIDENWIDRLAWRARHLSLVSQWLVCVALLLCLLSLIVIAVAIIRQWRHAVPIRRPPCAKHGEAYQPINAKKDSRFG